MRTLVAAATFIAASCFGAYAQVLRNIPPGTLALAQSVLKSSLFHASFGIIGAIVYLMLSRSIWRMLAIIPMLLACSTIWKILQLWPHVFP